MSLDIYLRSLDGDTAGVWVGNITHNLNKMAEVAGVYKHLWRPEELGIERPVDLIVPLLKGAVFMLENAALCQQYSPKNGWGTYDDLLEFILGYAEKCAKYPFSEIIVSR